MARVLGFLLLVVMAIVCLFLGAALFSGAGFLGSWLLFPWSHFETTMVLLGTALFLSVTIPLLLGLHELRELHERLLALQGDKPSERDQGGRRTRPQSTKFHHDRVVRIRRKQPVEERLCPCGSGKPFSTCCGN